MRLKSPEHKVLNKSNVVETFHKLHTSYVLVYAEKTASNFTILRLHSRHKTRKSLGTSFGSAMLVGSSKLL